MGGRTTTQKTEIDPALRSQSRRAMDLAELVATLPFSPNLGVTIAGFTPQQLAAQDAANAQASAFGLPSSGQSAAQTMPATQMSPSGIAGYSIADDYMGMRDASMPMSLQEFIMSMFRDPNNPGARPTNEHSPFSRGTQDAPERGRIIDMVSGGGASSYDNNDVPRGTPGGGLGALSGVGGMLSNVVSGMLGRDRSSDASSGTGGGK